MLAVDVVSSCCVLELVMLVSVSLRTLVLVEVVVSVVLRLLDTVGCGVIVVSVVVMLAVVSTGAGVAYVAVVVVVVAVVLAAIVELVVATGVFVVIVDWPVPLYEVSSVGVLNAAV